MPETLTQFTNSKPAPTLTPEAIRENLMGERQETLMKLARLEKVLGIEPTRGRQQQRRIEIG